MIMIVTVTHKHNITRQIRTHERARRLRRRWAAEGELSQPVGAASPGTGE